MNKDEVTLLDAGMGKTLAMRGVEIPHTIWSANALIVAPETVVDIHRENIDAGADVITVNSYGVIRSDLARANLESEFESLNRMAGQLAQRAVVASGKNVEIAGSLPPLNGSYRPDRVLDAEVMEPLYREQAGLLAPFVDLFLCETMSRISEAKAAATAAVETGKPVLISFTLHDDKPGCLRSGESLKDAYSRKYVGQDNVLWGTDSIWYGSPQDQIQAFRSFQISNEMQDKFGYPKMNAILRAKVFGLNALKPYHLSLQEVGEMLVDDKLSPYDIESS